MDGAILGLDHAIVGVADLAGARGDWERLGFVCTPLGNHVGKTSANHCIMFADTYVELLGVNEPWNEDWGLGDLLATRGEGVLKLALGATDAEAGCQALSSAGLNPGEPQDLSRPQHAPAPEGMVCFRNVAVPEADTAGLPLFLCCHATPELMRMPAWLAHPNGALALAAVTAVVADPASACRALGRIFPPGGRHTGFGAAIETGRGRIMLTTAAAFDMLHPGAVPPDREPPFWYALTIAVASLAATAECLAARGVAFDRVGPALRVAPRDARGVLLEFSEAG